MQNTRRILLLDDEVEIKDIYIHLLHNGFHVEASVTADELLARAFRINPDLLIINIEVPGLDLEVVCKLAKEELGIPIILLKEKNSATTLKLGSCSADAILYKPISLDLLLEAVSMLIKIEQ